MESIVYEAALAIKGTIRGTSKEKLYQEPCFEPLKSRGWFHKLSFFSHNNKKLNHTLSLQFNL